MWLSDSEWNDMLQYLLCLGISDISFMFDLRRHLHFRQENTVALKIYALSIHVLDLRIHLLSCWLYYLFYLFLLLELFIEPIEFLHFLNSEPVFLLGTYLVFATFNDGLSFHMRWLRCCSDFINDVRIDIVLEGRRVELLQPISDFLLRGELKEILETVPLFIVHVYRQLGLFLLFVP